MSLRSMTAFSHTQRTGSWGELSWEIRSVNHRYLEVSFRLPEPFQILESTLRARVSQALGRGKVDCMLKFQSSSSKTNTLKINRELITHLQEIVNTIGGRSPPTVWEILNFPGVLEMLPPDPKMAKAEIFATLEEGLESLIGARQREGGRLLQVLKDRSDAIRTEIDIVRARLPKVLARWHRRLDERLQTLTLELEPDRLHQEVVLLMHKLDVDEEIERLLGHLQEVEGVLNAAGLCGRRLDFLMQELNREANTLGSKSIDQGCTLASVEIKVLIEQMREQIQNIE